MRKFTVAMALAVIAVAVFGAATHKRHETVEFKQAELRVEINSTDGDAGLQMDMDHDPWSSFRLRGPDGRVLMDVRNKGDLKDYGLTELFSESSEPPFEEFPLDEFRQLFPEGDYVFEGQAVDGSRMRSTYTLTHDFPDGPVILSPKEDSVVAADELTVEWQAVDQPEGINIIRYQVLVVFEGDAARELALEVPPDVTSVHIPSEFLSDAGEYKVEVLAVEVSGNQTLTEMTVEVE